MKDELPDALCVVLACDLDSQGGLGPASLHRVARAVWRFEPRVVSRPIYIVSAGWNPQGIVQKARLATLMRERLVHHWSVSESDVVDCGGPHTWGSIAEIRAAKQWIQAQGLEHLPVYICSSWWHLPRLWLFWKLEQPYRNTALYMVASKDRHGVRTFSLLAREVVAIGYYLIKEYPRYLFSRM